MTAHLDPKIIKICGNCSHNKIHNPKASPINLENFYLTHIIWVILKFASITICIKRFCHFQNGSGFSGLILVKLKIATPGKLDTLWFGLVFRSRIDLAYRGRARPPDLINVLCPWTSGSNRDDILDIDFIYTVNNEFQNDIYITEQFSLDWFGICAGRIGWE